MTGPICTPIDSGGIWCQASISMGGGGLTGMQMLLVYLVFLAVTWGCLAIGRTR